MLDLVEPYMSDDTAQIRAGNPKLNEITKDLYRSRTDRPVQGEATWVKSKSCYSDDDENVHVRCQYGLFQDIQRKEHLADPHMVVMVNPGLGQPIRRTWDAVLRYVLRKRITTVVSTRTHQRPGRPGTQYDPWEASQHSKSTNLFRDEAYCVAEVMKAYGAQLLQSTVSPFPLIHKGAEGHWKNSVLAVYQGLRPGQSECKPQSISSEELKWFQDHKKDLYSVEDTFDQHFVADMKLSICPAYDDALRKIMVASGHDGESIFSHSAHHGRIPVWDWPRLVRKFGYAW